MRPDSEKVEKIYSGNIVKHYDLPVSHMFGKYKKQAFIDSNLKTGDKVIVFCCGTGLDFREIINRVGKNGCIRGIDFSAEMLKKAEKRIKRNNWDNIELIHADVTKYKNKSDNIFDAGICTLGISIIPDYLSAYYNLISWVRNNGEIIIGDMQLAEGRYAKYNPFTIFLAKRFGGSYQGHKNSSELYSIMNKELRSVRKKEFFLRSYYYCIGTK